MVQTQLGTFSLSSTSKSPKAQEDHHALVVKLKSCRKTHCAKDKDISEVRVPIKELLEGCSDAIEDKRQVSVSVLNLDGIAERTSAFAYKFR